MSGSATVLAACAEPAPRRVVEFVTNLCTGGTERQVVALCGGLDRERFDLGVACLRRTGDFLPEIEGYGIPVREYPVRRLYDPRSLVRRARLALDLRRERVDLVHCHGFYANMFAVPAARLAGTRAVIASVRDLNDLLWTPAQKRAQRLVCRLADVVLVNAEAIADNLVRQGHERRRIAVVANGIDLSRPPARATGELRRELGLPAGARLVVVVSRLVRVGGLDVKGIGTFLEAGRRIVGRFPDAHLLVVGDGPYRPELEQHAARLGLDRQVRFTGLRRDVPAVLAEAEVVVVPSLTEGLSNSLLEAMAAGVPVVATRVGGNPELVVDGEHGLLVPPADPAALATAVERLLGEAATAARLARAARERVAARFSLERMVRETARLYERLLAPRGRAAAAGAR
jgi:glycosyltransferase involved in cell wall biosynthesis